jgi:hypothetical protein
MHRCRKYSAIPAGCNKFFFMDDMGIFHSRRLSGTGDGLASGKILLLCLLCPCCTSTPSSGTGKVTPRTPGQAVALMGY